MGAIETSTERWRGHVDARLDNIEAAGFRIDSKLETLATQLQVTNLELKGVSTKIASWATVGALVGGGAISILIKVIFH